ncbi:MAG: spore maturation protein [Christensenellales bacterium]|jgi:spore maturation protein B
MVDYIIPVFISLIVIYGLIKKVNVYDAFIEGASRGLKTAAKVLPYLGAMLIAIAVFKAAGGFFYIGEALRPGLEALKLPGEVLPLMIVKPFSGSAALSALSEVYSVNGPDSYAGVLASVMMGSSETIFYTISIYAGSSGIKDLRYSVFAALISMLAGYAASVLVCNIFFM